MLKQLKLHKFKPSRKLRRKVVLGSAGLVILLTLTWKLRSLPAGICEGELAVLATVDRKMILSPDFIFNLPYNLLLLGVRQVSKATLAARGLSLGLAGLGLAAFFVLAREWWSRSVAAAGTVLLGTSYWFLSLSRLIGPHSLIILWLSALLLMFLKLKEGSKWWHIAVSGFMAGLSIYISPLAAWFAVILSAAAIIHSIRTSRGRIYTGWAVYLASALTAAVPYVVAALQRPGMVAATFGISRLPGPALAWQNVLSTGRVLLWDGQIVPLAVPNIGLLDAALMVLLLLGFTRTLQTWRLQRSRLLLALSGLALLVAALSSVSYPLYAYILPLAFLFVTRGLNQYWGEWSKRFPKNPSARIGAGLAIVILVATISTYNLRAYYRSWALNPTVTAQFH